jgi:hypothetical protein
MIQKSEANFATWNENGAIETENKQFGGIHRLDSRMLEQARDRKAQSGRS